MRWIVAMVVGLAACGGGSECDFRASYSWSGTLTERANNCPGAARSISVSAQQNGTQLSVDAGALKFTASLLGDAGGCPNTAAFTDQTATPLTVYYVSFDPGGGHQLWINRVGSCQNIYDLR